MSSIPSFSVFPTMAIAMSSVAVISILDLALISTSIPWLGLISVPAAITVAAAASPMPAMTVLAIMATIATPTSATSSLSSLRVIMTLRALFLFVFGLFRRPTCWSNLSSVGINFYCICA
ncbi:hypothetical protein HG530_008958 [Fusarium avenaceum]|nr:hypothetical protein HG530_008958 [Fusarium avenaceum]